MLVIFGRSTTAATGAWGILALNESPANWRLTKAPDFATILAFLFCGLILPSKSGIRPLSPRNAGFYGVGPTASGRITNGETRSFRAPSSRGPIRCFQPFSGLITHFSAFCITKLAQVNESSVSLHLQNPAIP